MRRPAALLLCTLLDRHMRTVEEEFKGAVLKGENLDTAIIHLRRNLDEIHEARRILKELK